jgi:hypothetical protein
MYPSYSPSDLLMREILADATDASAFQRLRPCTDCEADVYAYAREPDLSNLRFVGPVLVRFESGY